MSETGQSDSAAVTVVKKNGPLRRLYDWVLSWADTPYGTPALLVLSFAESSFFPIPPDVLQIALSAGKPRRAYWYATVTLIGSVLGALLGYYIGMALWDVTREFFYTYVFDRDAFALVAGDVAAEINRADPQSPYYDTPEKIGLYHEYGFWAVFGAAVTPIPYKIFTIAAGVCQISIPLFIFASIVGRGFRFYAVALLMFFFGEKIESWIDKYFNILSFVFLILLVGGFIAIKYFIE